MEKTNRKWGHYNVISKTKIMYLGPNKSTSFHLHKHKTEYWQILEGKGDAYIGGNLIAVRKGDSFTIHINEPHQLRAGPMGMAVLEVATGSNVLEEDKQEMKE
jgi:mannose-6-phosphate isomerase-like protein (cupin superfamily)